MTLLPRILDVTLRDGGCVNDFNFGNQYMMRILHSIESAGIDAIELGYLDNEKGSASGRTKFRDENAVNDVMLRNRKPGVLYLAMMDYGRFDVEKLRHHRSDGIDGIRLAFHRKNWKESIRIARQILDKGYKLFIQPMLTLHYTDDELRDMLAIVNRELSDANAIYIVDSFGEMQEPDLLRIAKIYKECISQKIAVGFHSHNNLQLSYFLAIRFVELFQDRQVFVDSSLSGMGKGAGNLCTELLMGYIHLRYGKRYNTKPILEVVDRVINVLKQETPWGYSLEYYLSSINHCSPSYASYFYNKQMLSIDQVGELLAKIDGAKKISFDRAYAERLYYEYKYEMKYDDSLAVGRLQPLVRDREIMLIAPGRSIVSHRELINRYISHDNVLSIGLNNVEFETDFTLITRPDIYGAEFVESRRVITTSRITTELKENVLVLDYHAWLLRKDKIYDSSAVVAFLIATKFGAKKIFLAGFDGFTPDVNENYFDSLMRRPVLPRVSAERNDFFRRLITDVRKNVEVVFLTPSKYES